jgi:hypothetical protein
MKGEVVRDGREEACGDEDDDEDEEKGGAGIDRLTALVDDEDKRVGR